MLAKMYLRSLCGNLQSIVGWKLEMLGPRSAETKVADPRKVNSERVMIRIAVGISSKVSSSSTVISPF